MSHEAQLAKAVELHEAGDLLAAGKIYRDILAEDPDHVDALNLLGVVMHAAGDLDLAIDLTTRATELAPDYFAPFVNLGNALQANGQLKEAVENFEAALHLNPGAAFAASNLSSALNDMGDYEDAFRTAEGAVTLMPELPDAQVNLGNALLGLGRASEAVAAYGAALELNPDHGAAWFNLGNAYSDVGDAEAALAPYKRAAEIDPGDAERYYNLANTYQKLDQFDQAITNFENALTLKPGYVDAECNLASVWQSLGKTSRAVEILRDALQAEPDSVDIHWNLSLALLQNGDMKAGWREYEWRWRTPIFADFKRSFAEPAWNGEDIEGRTVFIHAEQGFGDALQFIRYAPLVAAKGARVIVECRPELRTLFEAMPEIDTCIDLGAAPPAFDVYVPVMSLPHIFATDLKTVPDDVPYLKAPAKTKADPCLAAARGVKIGLAWSGSPTRPDNHKRSCGLEHWRALFAAPGVDFFSLQVGPAEKELPAHDAAMKITDLAPGLIDFAASAKAIEHMDLVISVDTSVLHLAGALGRPAWGLLSQPTGYLWMNDRDDSPWYPTLRLFRQSSPGDWAGVMSRVAEALAEFVSSHGEAK